MTSGRSSSNALSFHLVPRLARITGSRFRFNPILTELTVTKMASLVQGEDSESDEEINTDQLVEGSLDLSPSRKLTSLQTDPHKASIVPGEESETDEEDDGGSHPPVEQTDGGRGQSLQVPTVAASQGSSRTSSRRTSLDSTTQPPPS